MKTTIKGKVIKELFKNGDFRILSFSPIPQDLNKVKCNIYGTISFKGELGMFTVGENYEVEIEEVETNKYGTTYAVISIPSLSNIQLDKLSIEESKAILESFTTARQAENILSAYPDFISKIINEGIESIDTKKIYGVGEAYLKAYTRELTSRYKYIHILNNLSNFRVNVTDCKKLYEMFGNDETISEHINKEPYYVLIEILGRSFNDVDKLLCEVFPNLIESEQRAEAIIMDVLHRNEVEGSTKMSAIDMYNYAKDYDERLCKFIKDKCVNSEHIYYDDKLKEVALMNTYLGELKIANFIKEKLSNSTPLDIDWKKYQNNDDGSSLTDTQMLALKNLCESNISILKGYSGCVDAETQYFNGKEWKYICDYTQGEKVLQWCENGNAELVDPLRYIVDDCDEMYHFKTKYGLDQTLSGEHRVVFINKSHNKRKLQEITMEELYNKYYYSKNNMNKFPHNFITSFKYDGIGIDLTDEEIELMCAVICDGTFYSTSREDLDSWKTCRLHIKKDRKKNELRDLFRRGNFEYREKESSCDGYTDFYVTVPRREKEFGEYWYNCNNHQLQVICNNIIKWDGSVNTTSNGIIRRRFSTSIRATADFIQFAYSACGYKATIKINDRIGKTKVNKNNNTTYINKSLEYSVIISNRNELKMNNHNKNSTEISKVVPKGNKKYCFTVPSSYLVLRRNDKIFITGNCGKTFSVQGLIRLMDDNHLSYTLVSPTGKASRVLSESTNRTATTIHRRAYKGDIDTDVIIIDEFGMVGLDVFILLLNAVTNENARFVFVGDNAQIPSISLGKIFEDCINSNIIPTTSLTEVFRYKSNGSLFVATNIRQGKSFFNDTDMVKYNQKEDSYSVCDNYKFIQTEDIADTIISEYHKLLDKKIKPLDILILAPMNVGSIGTYYINNTIQADINPPKANEITFSRKVGHNNIIFRAGDIVINTKNDYKAVSYDAYQLMCEDSILTEEDVCDKIIVNGQIGIIREVIKDKGMMIQFDEDLIYFSRFKVNQLLLGYSISTYKAQGSTADYVINIVAKDHHKMLSRPLLYVADTRNRKKCIDVGSIDTFESSLNVVPNDMRKTFLKDLLLMED